MPDTQVNYWDLIAQITEFGERLLSCLNTIHWPQEHRAQYPTTYVYPMHGFDPMLGAHLVIDTTEKGFRVRIQVAGQVVWHQFFEYGDTHV